MLHFIKRLFGSNTAKDEASSEQRRAIPEREPRSVSDAYFDSMLEMKTAISQRDYEKAGKLVRENLK